MLIGVYATDRSASSISKIIGKLLSCDMVEAESDEYDQYGEFSDDTIIMSVGDFSEDILDIITQKDINIYLVR
jgi:hypothetical protein